MNVCKYCKSSEVARLTESDVFSYKGSDLNVPVEFSVCSGCGQEFITKEQIQNNDARLRDAKKKKDGLLTSVEIYNSRVKLGLTQDQAATVFGGGRNAFSKYERAEVSQSVAMDKLIKVCLRHPNVFNELLYDCGVKLRSHQFQYEDNVISYASYKAANREKYVPEKSKSVIMRDRGYEQRVN